MSTFDKALKGKEFIGFKGTKQEVGGYFVSDVPHDVIKTEDVQEAKREALKEWFNQHKEYCNFCEDGAICKTAQLTEKCFGRME